MAIKPGELITYGDLVDHFANWIQNEANLINVANTDDEYNQKVPREWRRGYSRTVDTDRSGAKEPAPINKVGATITIVDNSIIDRVTPAKVMEEFDRFMTNRGLSVSQKRDTLITTRGIINFWNNVAAFCSTNIVLVSSNENTTVRRMYKSNTSWPAVPNVGDSELIIASDVTTMLSNLEEVVNRTSKLHQIIYDIAAFSSSSSSSSCSCSCSSSSSSMYIAYMNI